ncbi:VQ motif-containing protein [Corchorus olitorius]|uniref:VQ motif-containing protein n=1 Tax=Corchorus olitorius TaxID=93759 RepID=A0A1R3JC17_9ROSI|nr:VQ motif-containing protein [Corchorus olitorius]
MNETASSMDQWMQFYQQTFDTSFDFSDATTVTTTGSSNNTSFGGGCVNQLTPKGCISKPIRRRSRASKRTPITLLNADAKNFRSLVQQLTGCRRRSTSISFGNPSAKGPVNINFALGAHNINFCSSTTPPHAAAHANSISQLLTNDYSPHDQSHQQQEDQHQQQSYQEQLSNSASCEEGECQFSDNYDSNITTDDFLLTSCLPRTAEIPQGFLMDDIYFLA